MYHGFSPEAEYVPWSALFNLSALRRLHPVIELEEYLRDGGGLGEHRIVPHGNVRRDCAATTLDFNGLEGVRSDSTVCEQGAQYAPANLHSDVRAMSFQQCVDQTTPNVVLKLRPWVRFEQGVYDEAAAFVAQTFGTEPFLAIHWRRTDFLKVRRSQPGVLQSAQDMVKHARTVMEQHGVKRVYLATDSNDESELAYVNAELQPARRGTPAGAEQSLRARAVHANVEIAICGMADYFLGTQTSSFTLAITEERQAVFGHAAGTGAEMGGTFWDFQRSTSIVSERSTRQADQRLAPMGFKDEL